MLTILQTKLTGAERSCPAERQPTGPDGTAKEKEVIDWLAALFQN